MAREVKLLMPAKAIPNNAYGNVLTIFRVNETVDIYMNNSLLVIMDIQEFKLWHRDLEEHVIK